MLPNAKLSTPSINAHPSSHSPWFLGLELATDQLRACVIDENLELVGVESVDFDTELGEYSTTGGIFTTPGEAYTTPVEMWIKGLDAILLKLHRNYDVARIKAIGGSAQHALVWWKSTPLPSLSSLDPHLALHTHFPSPSFSLPNTPTAQDTSAHAHALAIEALLGGPDAMASRVGTCAQASLVAAQLLRVREAWPQEVWGRTGRIQVASAFLSSLICGKWVPMAEAEACATGLWVHGANGQQGYWDERVLDIVGGSQEEGRRVRGWLGEVDVSGGGRKVGTVSRYLVERFGFDPEAIVTPFTSDYLASYLSCILSNDHSTGATAVLQFGPMDMFLTPAAHYTPSRMYSLYPHPAQDPREKRRYIAVLTSRNADVPRALVRDMYTKSWSAFDRLVAIVPPGGSIGLDDKLFSFWHLQADSYPYSRVKGIFRFESGVKVSEFRDLRANPRCLIESQVLAFRIRWMAIVANGVQGITTTANGEGGAASSVAPNPFASLGLSFNPYVSAPLPRRIICTGAAANFPSVANLVGDVFDAAIYVPASQVDSAQMVGNAHRNAPAKGYFSRASIGGAMIGRWVWGREQNGPSSASNSGRGSPSWGSSSVSSLTSSPVISSPGTSSLTGTFEDEMRRLHARRWTMSGGVWARTNVNPPVTSVNPSATSSPVPPVMVIGGMPANQVGIATGATPTPTPSTPTVTSGLSFSQRVPGLSVFEEKDYEINQRGMYSNSMSSMATMSSINSMSSMGSMSTNVTTPDMSLFNPGSGATTPGSVKDANNPSSGSSGAQPASANVPSASTLTPVFALPLPSPSLNPHSGLTPTSTTSYEDDLHLAQLGLAKVAEPDTDAFMTYAAIVGEYARLDGVVVRGT
ncbi:D-xylulose kinase [Lentinula detonsa]|uniref:D-xylulose kinase n=1 Tax=Lentinula detonsa TaxID=2804962 RepID=A0A9W8P4J5_9AGAR|nr:D-xylulose kinase [Lentinula detonsa]